jgi:hypothetical protein
VAALCAAAVPAATAPPAAASHGCSASARGAQVVTRVSDAIVFAKRGNLYGCIFSQGTVRRLPDEGGGIDVTPPNGPMLGGRFVAYSTIGSAAGDEFDRLYVYDIRRGRRFLQVSSNFITDIVVKRNGSVAWVEGSTVDPGADRPPAHQVRKFDAELREGVLLVDRGADIDPDSLVLGPDRTDVRWLRGGSERSAPLR